MLENLEIEEMVEQAASFVSYKTVHTKSGRKYLLRRYLVDESTGLDQVENWQEEFLTLVSQFSKVKSPTLRSILGGGIDEQDENPYIIFEWLYANTLRAVLLGVSALHERKVVHAGINLHSVLYNETQEKYKWVLDWNPLVVLRTRNGLNRFMEDEFACPELLVTNEASEMSDLYAIGKVVDASIGSEDEKQFILRWLLKMTSRKSARRYQSVDTALPDLVNLNIPDDIVVEEVPQVIHPPVASIQKETVQKEIVIPEVEKVISSL